MLKIFKYINVVGLVKRIIKYGDHITLIADTAKYWHTEAVKRKLIGTDETPAQITE